MKAVVVDHPGPPEVMQYREVPTPEAREGWTVVRVRAVGVNHSEVVTRQGLSPSVRFPRILGIECVGQIAQTMNPHLRQVQERNQTVVSLMGEMGRAFDGGYVEYVLLPDERVFPVQTSLTWEDLAAIPETYATALGTIRQLHLHDGQRLFIRGGSSGVAVAVLQLVRALYPSCEIVGSTRRPEVAKRLRALGYDSILIDGNSHLPDEMKPVDRVAEFVGPATLADTFKHVVPGGIVCSTGQLGGTWTMDGFDPITDCHGAYLTGFYSGEVDAAFISELMSVIAEHRIQVQPAHVLPLSQACTAHVLLESGQALGKIVLVP